MPDSAGSVTTGFLRVSSVPRGAGVFIKGAFAGVTPLVIERKPEDSLSVLVTKQFFQPWRTTVSLKAGETVRIMALPNRIDASLSILVSSPGASVFVDGRFAGAGPVLDFPVPAGGHELLVRDSLTGRSVRRNITIGEAQGEDYAAALGYHSLWRLVGSVVVPGYAQFADGAYLKGGGILTLSAAAVVFALGSAGSYSDRLGEYNAAVAAYGSASNEQDASIHREIMFQRHDDLNSAFRTRTASFALLGAVYALNIVDTILNHMLADEIRFMPGRTDVRFVASAGRSSLMLRTELYLW
jgi:hypothetical protein